jgi:hypothetical protein
MMDQISSAQLQTLSQQFLDMGNAILRFRENATIITDDQDSALEQLQNELLDNSQKLATMSAIASGQEAANAVASLSQVNSQITDTIKTLADVQKVIDIATAALKVVVAVVSMQPGTIVDSIGGLVTTCGIKI